MRFTKSILAVILIVNSGPSWANPSSMQSAKTGSGPSVVLSSEEIREMKELLKAWRAEPDRLVKLEESLDRLDAEIEILREQNRLMISRTTIGFRNQSYLKLGIAVVMPRARTFSFATDTGMGAFAGFGRYFGKHNVLEGTLDWDVYGAVSLRYRYEFQSSLPALTWGPVVGVKAKIASLKPFENLLDRPDDVRSTFWVIGGMVGFPIARSLVTVEVLYLTNQQSFVHAHGAFHFFL